MWRGRKDVEGFGLHLGDENQGKGEDEVLGECMAGRVALFRDSVVLEIRPSQLVSTTT